MSDRRQGFNATYGRLTANTVPTAREERRARKRALRRAVAAQSAAEPEETSRDTAGLPSLTDDELIKALAQELRDHNTAEEWAVADPPYAPIPHFARVAVGWLRRQGYLVVR